MMDLELMREMLGDDQVHLAIGEIKKLLLSSDRSVLKVVVSLWPEQRESVCRMSWDSVGEEAGFFMFPSVEDLVLVAIPDDQIPIVVSRLTSKVDKIPVNAAAGHMVAKALSGKELWLTSDTKINLSKGDQAPTENLVLGQVLKSLLSDMLDLISTHTHVGNYGYSTSPPETATDFTDLKADPVDNEEILSDIAFTEKGE